MLRLAWQCLVMVVAMVVGMTVTTGCGEPPAPAPGSPGTDGVPEAPAASVETPPAAVPRTDWPVQRVRIQTGFGWQPGANTAWHDGVDFGTEPGDFALAIASGTVADVTVRGDYVEVTVEHGPGFRSHYGRLEAALVHPGLPVRRGAAVGVVGPRTDHLHVMVTVDGVKIDPLPILRTELHPLRGRAKIAPPPSPKPESHESDR